MKRKLSISIETETIAKVENILQDGFFRNKSHLIEFALNKYLTERLENKNE